MRVVVTLSDFVVFSCKEAAISNLAFYFRWDIWSCFDSGLCMEVAVLELCMEGQVVDTDSAEVGQI